MSDQATMTAAVNLALLRRLTADGGARRLRTRNALSLAEVARAVGVTAPSVWRWEHGEQRPRGDAAARYAALLAELAALDPDGPDARD